VTGAARAHGAELPIARRRSDAAAPWPVGMRVQGEHAVALRASAGPEYRRYAKEQQRPSRQAERRQQHAVS
jgi:hypothetical protein